MRCQAVLLLLEKQVWQRDARDRNYPVTKYLHMQLCDRVPEVVRTALLERRGPMAHPAAQTAALPDTWSRS